MTPIVLSSDAAVKVSVYIAMDGGDARKGICYPYFLHGPGENGRLSSAVNSQTVIGNSSGNNDGPFPDMDGDSCGDINKGQSIYQTIRNISLFAETQRRRHGRLLSTAWDGPTTSRRRL